MTTATPRWTHSIHAALSPIGGIHDPWQVGQSGQPMPLSGRAHDGADDDQQVRHRGSHQRQALEGRGTLRNGHRGVGIVRALVPSSQP